MEIVHASCYIIVGHADSRAGVSDTDVAFLKKGHFVGRLLGFERVNRIVI